MKHYFKHTGVVIALMSMSSLVLAQMPKNGEKQFEYSEEASVKRAGTKELHARFIEWAKVHYKNAQYESVIDDSNYRYVTFHVTEGLIESNFGVNRKHTDRKLKYTLWFDTDKKDYTYKINNFNYECVETDRKGVEMKLTGPFEDFKSPTSRSVEEEIHNHIGTLVEAIKKAAEKELPDDVMEAIEAERDRLEAERDAAEEAREKAKKEAEEAAEAAAEAAEKAAKEAAEKAEQEAKEAEEKAAEEAEDDSE